jgi:hypothetical protein
MAPVTTVSRFGSKDPRKQSSAQRGCPVVKQRVIAAIARSAAAPGSERFSNRHMKEPSSHGVERARSDEQFHLPPQLNSSSLR